MAAYYNEFDPFAAAWLRELIKAGHIADGEVDTRSITDVGPGDLAGFTQCHFFAGIGGWSYALRLADWPDDKPVWTGSCPCQPFSLAGKQKGFQDSRHLWPEFRRLIAERRPAKVFGEQVASATAWLGLVRGDLEALEYAVGAMPIEAASAGADHLRDRFWFVADDGFGRCDGAPRREGEQPRRAEIVSAGDMVNPTEQRRHGEQNTTRPDGWASTENSSGSVGMADAHDAGSQGRSLLSECAGERAAGADGLADTHQLGASEGWEQRSGQQRGPGGDQEPCAWVIGADGKARRVKSGVRLLAHGFPGRVGLLRGFGNAIDPRPAAAFIKAAEAVMT